MNLLKTLVRLVREWTNQRNLFVSRPCLVCLGTGEVEAADWFIDSDEEQVTCPNCGGRKLVLKLDEKKLADLVAGEITYSQHK